MESRRTRDVFLVVLAVAVVTGALYVGINLYFTDGRLTLPLDDAYIFLQYARNFAAGHPLVYSWDAYAEAWEKILEAVAGKE